MKKALTILFFLSFARGMFADNLLPEHYTKVNCAVAFDQDKTFLTFFGDSLGDFVNENLFGYLSWETYLFLQKPQIDWNVQNFAVEEMLKRKLRL